MTTVKGCSVFRGKNIEISFEGPAIAAVKDLHTTEKLPYISPGFIDTQVNGYRGIDYRSGELKKEDIIKITKMLAASGTTSHFPTIITDPGEITTRNLKVISSLLSEQPELDSAVKGIHLEGPYISAEEGTRGAHDQQYIRDPDYGEFSEWQRASAGRIKQLTLAPERKGAIEFIKKVSSEGVIISIGHTAASPEIIREAVEAGARMSTHLGNGSQSMIPRLKNYIWEQLAKDRLSASIITDGFHLPSSVVKVILRAKELKRVILVSDITDMGGMKPGNYSWGDIEVEVFEDGHLGVAGTEYLAGSGHLLDHSLAWLMNSIDLSIKEAVSLCTVNPHKLFFSETPPPRLNPGDPADFTLFSWMRGELKLSVLETWRSGEKVYSAE